MTAAFAGYRVLELAHVIAGPVCGLYLAEMGADVIKVEEPGAGTRHARCTTPRPWPAATARSYLPTNRNKRSVTVDLTTTEGRAVFLRLVERADVVLEAYRGGEAAFNRESVNSGCLRRHSENAADNPRPPRSPRDRRRCHKVSSIGLHVCAAFALQNIPLSLTVEI